MAKRLLDRQVSLLKYLTSGAAIFGDSERASHDPQGIDTRLLHLEARFSHQKRMEKVTAVFPKTFEILGNSRAAIVREFAEACPPTDIGRLVNASQFYDFLAARPRSGSKRLYLRDVAACELACAKVRATIDQEDKATKNRRRPRSRRFIRRASGIALVRCAYDIRPIFERDVRAIAPEKRDTPLAVAMPFGASDPKIFEILPVAFNLLAVLDDWIDPAVLGKTLQMQALLAELLEHGLVEAGG
jgi:hypothetical protein